MQFALLFRFADAVPVNDKVCHTVIANEVGSIRSCRPRVLTMAWQIYRLDLGYWSGSHRGVMVNGERRQGLYMWLSQRDNFDLCEKSFGEDAIGILSVNGFRSGVTARNATFAHGQGLLEDCLRDYFGDCSKDFEFDDSFAFRYFSGIVSGI